MKRLTILTLFALLFLPSAALADIMNDSQSTGPFANINLAMATANPGDSFTVTGTVGGGTINVSGVILAGTPTGTIGPTVVDAQGVVLRDLVFSAGGAEVSAIVINSKADVTATNCFFTDAGTSAEVDTVVLGNAAEGARLTANGCTFDGATRYGLNLLSVASSAHLVDCTAQNNANDAIHLTGDNSVLTMDLCNVVNNTAEGVKSGADYTVMLVENSHFQANGSRDWETDSSYIGQIATFRNCTALNGGDRFCRLKGDDGEYLVENCVVDCNNFSDFIRLGDSHGSTLTIRDTCVFNGNGRIIQVDTDPSQISGLDGNNTVNLERVTFYRSDRGLENVTPQSAPNTWNIQYCIIAEWAASRRAIDNQDPLSTVTENNNVLANSNAAALLRQNVTPGANTAVTLGGTSISDLFCSTVLGNPDYIKVRTTSVAVNIDGNGGLAGGHTLCPATNPIVRGIDGAEFADLDAAVADAGTGIGDKLYVTGPAPGGLVNKNSITLVGPGPINAFGGTTTTAFIDVQANSINARNLTVDGSSTGGVPAIRLASDLTLENVSVLNAANIGIQVTGTGSQLTMRHCIVDRPVVNGVNVGGTNAVVDVEESRFSYSNDVNFRVGGSGHTLTFYKCTFTESENENYLSQSAGTESNFDSCHLTNAGRSLDGLGNPRPLGSRDNCVRVRANNETLNVTNCVLFGNDTTFRVDTGAGITVNVEDTCVYGSGRGSRMTSNLVNATHNFTNVTIDNCLRGLRDDGNASDVGNVWNIQYCIFSNWSESPGALPADQLFAIDDQTGNSTVNENYNVFADNDVSGTARNNVTPGASSVEMSEPRNLYCSQYSNNLAYLHVGQNSPAVSIDGIGGLAGCKPASCVLTLVSSTASANDNWNLYE